MNFVFEKAAASDLETCCNIMERIHGENPQHWPFGLHKDMLQPGGLYLVKDATSKQPAGFVGWQEFREGAVKVGYYSIGILPEFRQRGLAKSAVRQLLAEKAAGVDEVRAMIHRSNLPSLQLADSLGVPVEKVAMTREIAKRLGGNLIKGLLPAVGTDFLYETRGQGLANPETWKEYGHDMKDVSALRLGNLLLNSYLFRTGIGGYTNSKGQAVDSSMKKLLSIPTKDVLLSAVPTMGAYREGVSDTSTNQKAMLGILTAGLLGGLGYAGYKAFGPQKTDANKGRIRVTLPTRNPDDNETQVELPFDADSVGISNALQGQMARDLRRRLREESSARTHRRGVRPSNSATLSPPFSFN